jgi:hypothetical protein
MHRAQFLYMCVKNALCGCMFSRAHLCDLGVEWPAVIRAVHKRLDGVPPPCRGCAQSSQHCQNCGHGASVSRSVVKQIGAAPIFTRLFRKSPHKIFTRCGRAHTGPGVLSNGTTTKKRWDATLCRTSSQGHAKHGPQVVLHASNAYSPDMVLN